MTVEEAIKRANATVECIEREMSGLDEMCNNNMCDECNLNYERGTIGEYKEWLRMAINAMKLQQEKGRWIRVDKDKVKCSKCEVIHFIAQYPQSARIDYCPNCGRRMEGIEE